jgi:exonuclease SbcD
MRILHTSDWHLGKPLEQINRIEEQREFIHCLSKIVEEEQIDIVLISGDVYDTYNPPAVAEELFYDAVDMLNARGKRPVIVIAGNHDSPERLCAASALAYKNGIILLGYPNSDPGIYKINTENIKLVDSGLGWIELGISSCRQSAVILTLPYPSEARLEEVLSQDTDEKELQIAYSDKIGNLFGKLGQKFRKDTISSLSISTGFSSQVIFLIILSTNTAVFPAPAAAATKRLQSFSVIASNCSLVHFVSPIVISFLHAHPYNFLLSNKNSLIPIPHHHFYPLLPGICYPSKQDQTGI